MSQSSGSLQAAIDSAARRKAEHTSSAKAKVRNRDTRGPAGAGRFGECGPDAGRYQMGIVFHTGCSLFV
jgi:hypothetical protein